MTDSRLEIKNEFPITSDFSAEEVYLTEINSEEMSCPITLQIFNEPVSINGCGHIFEKAAIKSLSKCPLCRNEFKDTDITPALFTKIILKKKISDDPKINHNGTLEEIYAIEIDIHDITCPITYQIFYEPVSINGCGHVFEKNALTSLSKCPLCKNEFKDKGTTPSLYTKTIVQKMINDHPELTNQCYFSLNNLDKILRDEKASFPDLLIKILRHSNHLNAISEKKDFRGGTALTLLTFTKKGATLILKDLSIRANITAQGLNAAITVEGEYQGISALYWLAAGKMPSLFDDQSILSKITAEGLNRIIKTGPRKGLSPLYWIAYSCPSVLNNSHIGRLITSETLNHKVEGNLCVDDIPETGFSALFWLASSDRSQKILLDHEELRDKITSEGLETYHPICGYSVIYLLTRNGYGLEILTKDDKLRKKISRESLNRVVANGSAMSRSAVGNLITHRRGLEILEKDPVLRSKVSSESLNHPNKLGETPIYFLCQIKSGIKLLIEDQELTNKISAEGLNYAPDGKGTPLFYLTCFEAGQNLLLNNPRLIPLIDLNSLFKSFKSFISFRSFKSVVTYDDQSTFSNLSQTEVGKKILKLLFNTTDKIIILTNFLGKNNLGEKLIQIFSINGIREIVTDERNLIRLLEQFSSWHEANTFIKEIYGINIFALSDEKKSCQLNLFFSSPAQNKKNSFDFDDPFSIAQLNIFSFLNKKEVAIAKGVSTQFKMIGHKSIKYQVRKRFCFYVHESVEDQIDSRKKLKLISALQQCLKTNKFHILKINSHLYILFDKSIHEDNILNIGAYFTTHNFSYQYEKKCIKIDNFDLIYLKLCGEPFEPLNSEIRPFGKKARCMPDLPFSGMRSI